MLCCQIGKEDYMVSGSVVSDRRFPTSIVITSILLVALLTGTTTTMTNMPLTIGSTNAQSQEGSEHACPTGYTLSQGRCNAEPIRALRCANIGVTPIQIGTDCFVVGPSKVITSQACSSVGGTNYGLVPSTPNAFCEYQAFILVTTCPGGITPTSGQCITKPGRGNQP
jgi:hypothetical protein